MATVREMQRILKLKLEELKQRDALIDELEQELEKRDLLVEKLWNRLEKYKSVLEARKKFDALKINNESCCEGSLNEEHVLKINGHTEKDVSDGIGIIEENVGRNRSKSLNGKTKLHNGKEKQKSDIFKVEKDRCGDGKSGWGGVKGVKGMMKRVAISAEPSSGQYFCLNITLANLTKVPKSHG